MGERGERGGQGLSLRGPRVYVAAAVSALLQRRHACNVVLLLCFPAVSGGGVHGCRDLVCVCGGRRAEVWCGVVEGIRGSRDSRRGLVVLQAFLY